MICIITSSIVILQHLINHGIVREIYLSSFGSHFCMDSSQSLKKQVALCTIGTLVEWYEFTIFASLAPIISTLFFPHSNPFAAMMGTFTVFASGYLMRPLGAFFFGHLGDTIGRKYTLLITIFLMSGATLAIGLIPIGAAFSTVLLVICRLIQGFASSGEYPGGLTLLAEQNNPKRRGLISSFGVFATGLGSLMGALVYAITLKYLGYETMVEWGWRIPFLLAAPLGVIGLILRKHIFESPEFSHLKQEKKINRKPIVQLFKYHTKSVMATLSISILTNTLIYIDLLYFSNYALNTHKLTTIDAMNLYLLVTFIYSLSILFFGFLADYINKKFMMMTAAILIISLIYSLFAAVANQNVAMQFVAQGIIAVLIGMILGPFASVIAEQFPAAVRYTGVSVTLNLAGALFGGTAPIICAWLTFYFGTFYAPVFYIVFIALIAFGGMIFIDNTSKSFKNMRPLFGYVAQLVRARHS